MEETWKEIVYDGETYEDYQVSNLGRVKSLWFGKERILRPSKTTRGYLQVELYKNGKSKWLKVHRLVATAFLDNPDGKPEVNHKIDTEEGKTMNFVFFNEYGTVDEEKTTIEWCDRKYNNNYGSHNEKISKANTNGKKSKPVLQLTFDGKLVREWPSTQECGRNGFNHSHVSACCNGKLKSHKGFRWKYK